MTTVFVFPGTASGTARAAVSAGLLPPAPVKAEGFAVVVSAHTGTAGTSGQGGKASVTGRTGTATVTSG